MNGRNEYMSITMEDGIFKTDIPVVSDHLLKACFRTFLEQTDSYRKSHLQKNYGYAFDGYSYYGQQDSSNQAYDDLLETFVLSNFFPADKYPTEFSAFFKSEWTSLLKLITSIENRILSTFQNPQLLEIHSNIGHMVSCNHYPAQQQFDHTAAENTRLSAHPDVSLLTIFPSGIDGDLQYETPDGLWKSISKTDKIIGFSGYLMERATDGKVKALNHRVKLSENRNKERFSFAFFSLPFPESPLTFKGQQPISGKEYFEQYLNLF